VAAKRRDTSTTVERGDEDALDPVEARDVDTVEGDELEEAGLSELDVDEDGFDDEDDEDEVDEVDGDAEDDAVLAEGGDGEDEVTPVVPAEAAFDDEDEALVVAAVVGDDDDDDDGIEGLRDGEFVCRSCYMAKRESQLADADAMLCRDCA
jgi:hypothetical protein